MKQLLIAGVAASWLAFAGLACAAVDLNSATAQELQSVPGIGRAKAQAIVDYRGKNGPFKSIDDLKAVKGFGAKTVDKLHKELMVGGAREPGLAPDPDRTPQKAAKPPTPPTPAPAAPVKP